MQNTNEWFVFDAYNSVGVIDKKSINKIKRFAKNKWEEPGVDTSKGISDEERKTGKKGDFKPDSNIRVSDIAWCNEQWLYKLIWPFMEIANQDSGWRFDIKGAESCQITRYRKGGFYNLHSDGRGDHLSSGVSPRPSGYVRKLSMSVMLNDNFEGGAFEFASYAQEECNITSIEAEAGSVIVFPSCMEHRVAPIIKGIRYSVVCWFVGPPFV